MVVFIKIFNEHWSVLNLDGQQNYSGFDIKRQICLIKGIPEDDIFLTHNGLILDDHWKLNSDQDDSFVHCHLRVPGGKGGFGSMLRAIGAQIEKTTNHEACRDLSGRRMRDVNDEKKIADWLSKQAERDKEKSRRKQERLERLRREPKHVFEDSTTYTSQIQENMDSIEDALQKGLKSSSSGQSTSSLGKRKAEVKESSKKKRKLWLGIDEELSSDSEEESDAKSSCSSITDSDYSCISENSHGKLSSSTSNNDFPSGNTSESESNVVKPGPSDENCDNSEPKTVNTEKNKNTSDHFNEQQKQFTPPDARVNEQTVKPQIDKQETLTSSSYKSTTEMIEDEKVTELRENTARTEETKNEMCSNTSACSTTGIERKCGNSEERKEEQLSGECEEVNDKTSAVSLPVNLDGYQSPADLEALGLDVLKSSLMDLGLKCGGTLQQRAERLFSVKGIPREKIDPSLFAKPSGKKKEKKR